jgi:hypothetical protein
MASPDIKPYVDLTVYDQQPNEIYDAALDYGRAAIPEWTPQAGTVEDAILQAASGVAGELLAALNRVPSSVLEALLKLFGIDRLTGDAATVDVRITFIDDLGHTVPSGTRFGYLDNTGGDSVLYVFETTAEASAESPSTYVDVEVTGILIEEYPFIESGTELRLLSGISYIESVELLADISVGSIGETDEEYFSRGIALLNSYTSALVLPDQYESYLLANYSTIYRAKAYSLLDPSNNDATAEPSAEGYLTVYACGIDGASLSAQSASAIVEDLTAKSVGGLIINVEPPALIDVTVTTTYILKTGYNSGDVTTAVETALTNYLGPNSWMWKTTVYYNELISLIDQVPGVERVESLVITGGAGSTVSGDNLDFDAYGSLPVPTLLVTAQA